MLASVNKKWIRTQISEVRRVVRVRRKKADRLLADRSQSEGDMQRERSSRGDMVTCGQGDKGEMRGRDAVAPLPNAVYTQLIFASTAQLLRKFFITVGVEKIAQLDYPKRKTFPANENQNNIHRITCFSGAFIIH